MDPIQQSSVSHQQVPVTPAPQDLHSGTTMPLQPQQPKKKHSRWTIIGLCVGVVIIFLIAIIIFQPQAYFWLVQRGGFPSAFVSGSEVTVDRTVSMLSDASQEPLSDALKIVTDAQRSSDNAWSLKTSVYENDQLSNQSGVDVVVRGQDVFQRAPAVEASTPYTKTPFSDEEIAQTVKAFESSALLPLDLLSYATSARTVFASGSQAWWLLHYRYEVPVAQIAADAPEWYVPEYYPFSLEQGVEEQDVTFVADVWVHPFTGRVMHEEWAIRKTAQDSSQYQLQLDIRMQRDYSYPEDISIPEPPTA